MKKLFCFFGTGLWLTLVANAADWNEWRGPGRDGCVADSPPLMDAWPTQGLTKVWQSDEKIPGDKAGGFGSVAVAGGRVFCIYAPGRVEKGLHTRDNVAICLDAATGQTVWKRVLPGGDGGNGTACTPCVANGKCYGFGEGNTIFCLDAATGHVVWSVEAGKPAEKQCSFIVEDGVAVAPIDPLTGFEAETGKVLWTNAVVGGSYSSAARWKSGDKTFLIVRGSKKVLCLEPKTGATVWTLNDDCDEGSTPAIDGDRMVLAGGGLRIFKLSSRKAELLFTAGIPLDYCAGPTLFKGHAYVWGRGGGSCVSLETGKVVWKDPELMACAYSTAVCADGKMFINGCTKATAGSYGDGSLAMFLPSPERGKLLGKTGIQQVLCTTPAIVEGRVYCRVRGGVACYNLRK